MNWKKLMAVTMALCMAVPSGIPQTIMGAEFTQGTQTQVTEVSEFDDGMGNDCDETEAENIEDLFPDSKKIYLAQRTFPQEKQRK